ncbi:hypothetical protein GE061_008216 [Apolygus lucorum]|uniref:Type VII secretion system protein EssD-like domain-containing protein n=1 Tax=Apolygus lucorum TaxID=248454 RepID=A0A6A4IQ00_APOLU|nr:hypothetical protein GE061_008216 [Apolygus lucorum]
MAGLIAALQLTVECFVDPIKEVKRHGADGRVEYIKAELTPNHLPSKSCHQGTGTTAAVRAYAKQMGCNEDFAGHLVARCLGGVGSETYNIVPQNPSANRHWFHDVEKKVFDLVHGGKSVSYEIQPIYGSPRLPNRPTVLSYKVTEGNNVLMTGTYPNPEPDHCTH